MHQHADGQPAHRKPTANNRKANLKPGEVLRSPSPVDAIITTAPATDATGEVPVWPDREMPPHGSAPAPPGCGQGRQPRRRLRVNMVAIAAVGDDELPGVEHSEVQVALSQIVVRAAAVGSTAKSRRPGSTGLGREADRAGAAAGARRLPRCSGGGRAELSAGISE